MAFFVKWYRSLKTKHPTSVNMRFRSQQRVQLHRTICRPKVNNAWQHV